VCGGLGGGGGGGGSWSWDGLLAKDIKFHRTQANKFPNKVSV
jgi:hypothetical protein